MGRNKYMVTITDPIRTTMIGLLIICCILGARNYWKVKNTDAFMWVLVAFSLCVDALYKPLQI
jgi:hypothetical protein